MRVASLITVVGLAFLTAACSEVGAPTTADGSGTAGSASSSKPSLSNPLAEPVAEEMPNDLVSEGRQAYLSTCIACHNPDPKLDGPLGPSVAGASEALLKARILHGEYPDGYTPKRDTRSMVPMPFLEGQIPALPAYLASP